MNAFNKNKCYTILSSSFYVYFLTKIFPRPCSGVKIMAKILPEQTNNDHITYKRICVTHSHYDQFAEQKKIYQ